MRNRLGVPVIPRRKSGVLVGIPLQVRDPRLKFGNLLLHGNFHRLGARAQGKALGAGLHHPRTQDRIRGRYTIPYRGSTEENTKVYGPVSRSWKSRAFSSSLTPVFCAIS